MCLGSPECTFGRLKAYGGSQSLGVWYNIFFCKYCGRKNCTITVGGGENRKEKTTTSFPDKPATVDDPDLTDWLTQLKQLVEPSA